MNIDPSKIKVSVDEHCKKCEIKNHCWTCEKYKECKDAGSGVVDNCISCVSYFCRLQPSCQNAYMQGFEDGVNTIVNHIKGDNDG
jgi:hypothetical protein